MSPSDRARDIESFLKRSGWGAARRHALVADASSRRYERLYGADGPAILMDAPPGDETSSCPPGANEEERAALGYNALARLSGSDTRAYAALAEELVARGFSAPKIMAADHEHNLLLLEDLGDDLFARIAVDQAELYGAAVDTLAALSRSSFGAKMPFGGDDWTVLDYDNCALMTEANLLIDWYAPYRGAAQDAAAHDEVEALWRKAFAQLDALPRVLSLRDVHAENLMWLPDREGVARVGLIDFQDALFGSPAYDLVSLLQDSRRDLPDGLEETMIARFIEQAKITDPETFLASYAILGAQRSAKVLGIFVRLAKRDGKERYLQYLPITARKIVRSLSHPVLAELQKWMQDHVPAIFTEGQE